MLDILVVTTKDGVWESEWRPLQGTAWAGLMTIVSKENMDHALHGYSKPLTAALGLPPEGCLRKVPLEHRECSLRNRCALYKPKLCVPSSPEVPWCFEPSGVEDGVVKTAVSRLIQTWKEGAYVVVVME